VADVITTGRLDLVALEPAILALIERDEAAAVERQLSVRVPTGRAQTVPARLRLALELDACAVSLPWSFRRVGTREPVAMPGACRPRGSRDDERPG